MSDSRLPDFVFHWQWNLLFFGLFWPGISAVLIPQYIVAVTGSAADAGVVMGIIGLGALLAPVFGHLNDAYDLHRATQVGGYAIVTAGLLLMGNAEDEMLFFVSASMIGIGLAGAALSNTVYITGGNLDPETEAKALSRNLLMLMGGAVLGGFLVAGLLQLDVEPSTLFAIVALIPATGFFLSILLTRQVAKRVRMVKELRSRDVQSEEPRLAFRQVIVSAFGLTLLIVFLNHLGWSAIVQQYANFLEGAFGIDQSLSASVNSIAVGVSLVIVSATGRWAGRTSPVLPNSVGIGLRVGLAVGLLLVAALIDPVVASIPLALWVGFRFANPLIEVTNPALAARTAPIGAAQAQAFLTVAFALAITVGSGLGGGVAEEFGWAAAPWVTVIACGLALLLSVFGLAPRLKGPTAEPVPSELVVAQEDAHL